MTQLESMIRYVIGEYIEHSTAKNVDGVTNLFLDNAIVSDGRQIHAGRRQIAAMFAADMRNRANNYRLETEIMDISPSDSGLSAVVHKRFSVTNGTMTTNGLSIMHFNLWGDKARIAAEIVHVTETITHSEDE